MILQHTSHRCAPMGPAGSFISTLPGACHQDLSGQSLGLVMSCLPGISPPVSLELTAGVEKAVVVIMTQAVPNLCPGIKCDS